MISDNLTEAKRVLDSNNLVAIPTETVYGLAGNAYNVEAVEKIFALKKRPHYNPLIVHIATADQLNQVAKAIPEAALTLALEFWPGPLTLVLKKQSIISDAVSSGKDTVAVRVPNHPLTLELLKRIDYPLAAPSANPFGSISPTNAKHVRSYFENHLELILDGGDCERGIESTIIGFENETPVLYRLGSLALEQIEDKIGRVIVKNQNNDASPASPGMLSRHYAPATTTYVTDEIEKLLKAHSDKKIGVLLFQHQLKTVVEHQEVLSTAGDLTEAAKNLYAALHRLDSMKLDLIIAEKLPDTGLGKTLNDKLKRASKSANL
ncbi:MAG: threonylcarbamoyl-AMP synthase [Crocinitomicaceae bacterium]|nr:threonylcarbamoyl-AMP synthase [Crocinitomicaceae bacterium]|tara:strand:+ start:268936 stop:269898 length:963 start_codon:yes stop_codon:yes gene_type:complete